jgi:hypothetical protein
LGFAVRWLLIPGLTLLAGVWVAGAVLTAAQAAFAAAEAAIA